MDCNKAAEATLQYMEKTIKPATAKALALHLLDCESCREYFTALDMTMDALDEGAVEFSEAPPGFTESVMEKVNALPAYHEKKNTNYKLIMRIAGGITTVVMGVVLMITSGMTVVGQDGLFATISGWAESVVARFTQDGAGTFGTLLSNVPAFGLSALALAAVISVLLVTLQRSEQGGKVKA
jgi:predicted anti-sigma-YlaC factor YlaD